MSDFLRKIAAIAVATSLLAVPTGAIAAARATPAPTPQQAANTASANPWVTLSAMTSSSGAASAAAAQGEDDEGPGFPPIPPLVVILGTIALAVYILTKDDDSDLDLPFSP